MMCKSSPGRPQNARSQIPHKTLGRFGRVLFEIYLGALRKKYRISLFLRAISWDPLENRSGANRTKKHQRSASEPGAERQGKGAGTAMSPLTTYIPPYILF